MGRKEKDPAFPVEEVIEAISVVNVPIHDENPFQPIFFHGEPRRQAMGGVASPRPFEFVTKFVYPRMA